MTEKTTRTVSTAERGPWSCYRMKKNQFNVFELYKLSDDNNDLTASAQYERSIKREESWTMRWPLKPRLLWAKNH